MRVFKMRASYPEGPTFSFRKNIFHLKKFKNIFEIFFKTFFSIFGSIFFENLIYRLFFWNILKSCLKNITFKKKMFPQKNQWKISSYFWFSRKAKYVRLEGRRVRLWMRICEIWPAAKLTNSNSELSVILVRSVDVQKHTNVRCFSTDSSVDKQPFLERTRRIPRIPLYFIKIFS